MKKRRCGGGGGGEEEEAIITHLFSFIHGLQNGHVQFLQSRQDVDVFPQVWSEVFWEGKKRRSVQHHSAHTLARAIYHTGDKNQKIYCKNL